MSTEIELAKPPVDIDKLDTAKPLAEIFQPYNAVFDKWEAKAAALVVTDIKQKTEMAQARLARLELKEARVSLDKTRKGLVEQLKERTTKIDAAARFIRQKFEDLEEKLLESEDFADRYAAKLKADLKIARETELKPFLETPLLGDLSDLSEENYAKMLADAKLLRQAKIDAAAKAESDRKAKEEADRVERERVAAENARLKAEALETARLAEIERKRIEAERAEERNKAQEEAAKAAEIARVEREAALKKAKTESDRLARIAAEERKRIEAKAKEEAEAAARARAELAAKQKAEQAERARLEAENRAAEAARRKAASAPDKAKLLALVAAVRELPLPIFNQIGLTEIVDREVESLAKSLKAKAEAL